MPDAAAPQCRQLRMRRPHLDDLPELEISAGYGLRTYRPGDEPAWGRIMESPAGIGQEWTVAKVRERLVDRPQFEPAGLFFATHDAEDGRPVASACAWRLAGSHADPRRGLDSPPPGPIPPLGVGALAPEETATGILHMVCALPEHRRRGLGRLVSLAVLRYLRARGFVRAELSTDDFRLAAIKSYLGLGFVPLYPPDRDGEYPADDHEARWSAIFATIAGPRRT